MVRLNRDSANAARGVSGQMTIYERPVGTNWKNCRPSLKARIRRGLHILLCMYVQLWTTLGCCYLMIMTMPVFHKRATEIKTPWRSFTNAICKQCNTNKNCPTPYRGNAMCGLDYGSFQRELII